MNSNAHIFDDDDDIELPGGGTSKQHAWGVSGKLVTGGNQTQGLLANFDEPGEYTIEFGIELPTTQHATYSPPRAEADITFSAAGFAITRRVTLSNGLTISGTGQSVRVVIRDVVTKLGLTTHNPFPGEEYLVTATVVKGVRPTGPIPPMLSPDGAVTGGATGEGGTYFIDPGLTGASANVPVPQGVGVTGVFVSIGASAAIPTGLLVVEMYGHNHSGAGYYDPRLFQWVPLVPGVEQINIVTKVGCPPVFATVYFAIDG